MATLCRPSTTPAWSSVDSSESVASAYSAARFVASSADVPAEVPCAALMGSCVDLRSLLSESRLLMSADIRANGAHSVMAQQSPTVPVIAAAAAAVVMKKVENMQTAKSM